MKKNIEVKSLKSNFAFNLTRKVLTYLFPIIIFPYVNRILGPENIGSVRFAESVVGYFVLFAGIGIPSYGLRAVARTRDDLETRSKTVWELTVILLITSMIAYVVYFVLIFHVNRFSEDLFLFLIVSPTILLSDFSYEWFYQGIENQSFITIRFILVKVLQIFFTFLLIHSENDYYYYAAILVGMSAFSSFFNLFNLRKYIRWFPFRNLNIRQHLKSISAIFISSIAISIYAHLDVVMVGLIAGDIPVGYYTTSNTIVRMVVVAVIAAAEIFTPRIENALNRGDSEKYKRFLDLSIMAIMVSAVPACMGLYALSKDIIVLFAGDAFMPSVASLKLLCPIIIVCSLAYFVGCQVLYSQRREWRYSAAVVVAAIVNAISNAFFIPCLQEIGAVIGTLVAESIGLAIQLWFAKEIVKNTALFSWDTLKIIIASLVMYLLLMVVPISEEIILVHMVVCVLLGITVYASLLLLMRVDLAFKIVFWIKSKIKA